MRNVTKENRVFLGKFLKQNRYNNIRHNYALTRYSLIINLNAAIKSRVNRNYFFMNELFLSDVTNSIDGTSSGLLAFK